MATRKKALEIIGYLESEGRTNTNLIVIKGKKSKGARILTMQVICASRPKARNFKIDRGLNVIIVVIAGYARALNGAEIG